MIFFKTASKHTMTGPCACMLFCSPACVWTRKRENYVRKCTENIVGIVFARPRKLNKEKLHKSGIGSYFFGSYFSIGFIYFLSNYKLSIFRRTHTTDIHVCTEFCQYFERDHTTGMCACAEELSKIYLEVHRALSKSSNKSQKKVLVVAIPMMTFYYAFIDAQAKSSS
jgi:hypothetical protein